MHSRRLRLALSLACLGLFAGAAHAQRLTAKGFVDEQNGYRLQPPDGWHVVPVEPGLAELGVLARIESGERGLDLLVLRSSAGAPGERKGFFDVIDRLYGEGATERIAPLEQDEVEVGDLVARHRQVRYDEPAVPDLVFDAWSFTLPDRDVELVFSVQAEDKQRKRWLQTFRRCAKTFAPVALRELVAPSEQGSYEAILAFHQAEAARTPGWRAQATPSRKYVIKTSARDQGFVDEVVQRLELSRALYERDFPPRVAMEHVSVVRLCGTAEEFHRYGGTGGGVAGWYNPESKELVLYDAKNVDRNASYAVMSHEAFHQYCHFLFDRSEAHRWFDEGHGDYYGGVAFERGRAKITPHMPGGLDRLSIIREMITDGSQAPLRDHLRFSHAEWQSQGPSNVSCYAQSWSIVYFLRQGVLGNVSRKVWKDEYAAILPSYTNALFEGFQAAYRELRAERLADAEREGEGGSVVLDEQHPEIDDERKQVIWDAAIEAAWGRIDLDQLERDWLLYVDKYLE